MTGVQRLLEVGLLLAGALAIFLLLALLTFHPADPGWTQSGSGDQIHNAAGAIGAWFADVLLFTFGFVAYLLPFAVMGLGYLVFHRTHHLLSLDYLGVSLRIVGALLLLTGAAALASLNFADIYRVSSGGVLGDVVSSAMLPYFNLLGTTLLLLTFVMTGFTLVTGISWLTIADKIGYAVSASVMWIYHAFFTKEKAQQDEDADDDEPVPVRRQRNEPLVLEHKSAADPYQGEAYEQAYDAQFAESESEVKAPWYRRLIPSFSRRKASAGQGSDTRREPGLSDNLDADTDVNMDANIDAWDSMPPASTRTVKVPADDDDFEIDWDTPPSQRKGPAQAPRQTAVDANDDVELADDEAFTTDDVFDDGVESNPTKPAAPVKAAPSQPATSPATLLPTIELLDRPNKTTNPLSQEELDQISGTVEAVLKDFGVEIQVAGVQPGPVITRFELDLAPGVKVSKISNLSKDIARSLSALAVRVVEVIPGKSYVGLELPNKEREIVWLREVISCDAFQKSASPLTMVLGKDIAGKPVVVDLAKMPHLLVAGTTGSGKSVGVNVMILSLLYKSQPEDVRLIMIDPKMLELSVYEGIPHLLTEVVTDMKDAANALRWCVGEMERRYKLMSAVGVRNLKGYNAKIEEGIAAGEPLKDPTWKPGDSMHQTVPELEKLPHIVVVVDEFADMMMIVGKKVEELIARIAQKARAAGIHLILATQRPSVDVITGLIKANIPTRIAFQVSSKIDSRTILDQPGAEQLLGQGDMLYLPPGSGVPTRVHGAFVDDHEVHKVVADWKARQKPKYLDEILSGDSGDDALLPGEQPSIDGEELDPLFDEAVAFVTETRRVSVSSVQRKFRIGYNRAARVVEQMEMAGVVSNAGHNGSRDVLAPPPPRD
ncbi:cell division protein FtsK [Aliidiomarina maris]|uniref:DNA translocase FtsK n=2 Tax=Aliidiomarina maris TaxID=531312 RepID=A0A327WV48_9GAMM|nr:DNA translocase FtsK [Aliidiomarina maris]RUO23799.1 cell division protein FtsK [Aliidiomarina maris]